MFDNFLPIPDAYIRRIPAFLPFGIEASRVKRFLHRKMTKDTFMDTRHNHNVCFDRCLVETSAMSEIMFSKIQMRRHCRTQHLAVQPCIAFEIWIAI